MQNASFMTEAPVGRADGATWLDSEAAAIPDASGMSSANALGTYAVANSLINIWSAFQLGSVQAKMQKRLAAYNNNMRAISMSMQQFTADKNRQAFADEHAKNGIGIDIAKMRAESELQVQAAFTGASSFAKAAAMADVDRSALTLKAGNDARFEGMLQQVQLQEYGNTAQQIQSNTNHDAVQKPSLGMAITGGVLSLTKAALENGAADKGSKIRTWFSDL